MAMMAAVAASRLPVSRTQHLPVSRTQRLPVSRTQRLGFRAALHQGSAGVMHQYVTNVCASAYVELRRTASIRQYLSCNATKTMIYAVCFLETGLL